MGAVAVAVAVAAVAALLVLRSSVGPVERAATVGQGPLDFLSFYGEEHVSNFALVPQGSLIVSDVVVATQQFIDSAPSSWKDQWSHIVNVDGITVGPDWVYDPGSGSFYPPAPPPPPSESPIVSYDQLLAREGYAPDVTGLQATTSSDPANFDVQWVEDRLFQGIEVSVASFADPSSVDFQVVHPVTGDVIDQWGTDVPVPPDGKIKTNLSAAAPIPAGAIVRLVFHGAVGAKVYLLYRTWVKS